MRARLKVVAAMIPEAAAVNSSFHRQNCISLTAVSEYVPYCQCDVMSTRHRENVRLEDIKSGQLMFIVDRKVYNFNCKPMNFYSFKFRMNVISTEQESLILNETISTCHAKEPHESSVTSKKLHYSHIFNKYRYKDMITPQ